MNGSIDSLLTCALYSYSEKWMAELPDDGGEFRDHVFSPAFEKKMLKLLSGKRSGSWLMYMRRGQKAAAAAAVILVMMSVTVFGVKAFREPAVSFIVNTYEKFSVLIFGSGQEKPDEFPASIKEHYGPAFIPEGFVLKSSEDVPKFYQLEYSDNEGNLIYYSQFVIKTNQLTINTEGADYEYIEINGHTGIYFSNKGYKYLVWNDERYGFNVNGTVSKELILEIARSLEERDK